MYAIIIILALSLFSPLPFISPYEYVLQDAVAQSSSMENFNRQPLKLVNTLYLSPAASITDSTKYPTLYGVNSITTVAIDDSIYALVVASGDNGVQIIDITDPYNLTSVSSITADIRYPTLNGPESITTVTIDDSTYALVAAYRDKGVQIINITDPYRPTSASSITDGTKYPELDGAESITTVTIDDSTYALVAASRDNGVQIINITDPYNPTSASSITDGTKYPELDGAESITTVTIDDSTYALVAASRDNGVQIINITDPYNPTSASSITDGTKYPELDGAESITTVTIDDSTYALVAASRDNGVQIINITDPYNPTSASSITDGTKYLKLNGARSITTTTIDDSTYALVAAFHDDGVQIIDITDPYNPTSASSITDGTKYPELDGAKSITTVTIGNSTYALVAAFFDNGVQIIKLTTTDPIIISSNANSSYAKTGNTLTIKFTTNSIITSGISFINGVYTTIPQNSRDFIASMTVRSTPMEGYAYFDILVRDGFGSTLSITEDDVSSNVFVDTIPPTIALIGDDNLTIFIGTRYIEQNAIAYDESYGNVKVTGVGTVNTQVSDTYTIIYTSPADYAGNVGIVTRTVNVLIPPLELAHHFAISPVTSITDGTIYPTLDGPESITTIKIGDSNYALVAAFFDDGVQIINITDPYNPTSASSVTSDPYYPGLNGAESITTVAIGDSIYALVASYYSNGVQIINITDPYNPTSASSVNDGTGYPILDGARSITTVAIGISIYALVTTFHDDSVQIINIDNPYNPIIASSITDGASYPTLDGARSITTVTIDDSTYALVAASDDNGVQIINITDPYNPTSASSITDGEQYPELHGVRSITTVTIDDFTYALTAALNDNGVQIINITDPYNPTSASSVTDGAKYPQLSGAESITTVTIDDSTYALVAAVIDSGVQIINITDPYNHTSVTSVTDGAIYPTLYNARSITTTIIDGTTYALVASLSDDGVQIIKLSAPILSITSNNTNSSYAKTGDTLSIEFTTSNIITSGTASIFGLNSTITQNGHDFKASIIVPSTPREGYASFDAQVTDIFGATLSITEDDLDFNVFVDTIPPTITLNGESNLTISIGTIYVDQNATAYDASYGDIMITGVGTVDTQVPGTYTLNYTPKDYAGNIGSSVTRTINVFSPIKIVHHPDVSYVTSSNINSSYAKAGDTLSIEFTTNNIITSGTASILGLNPTIIQNGHDFKASIIVPSTPMEGYAIFDVQVTDIFGTTLSITEDDLDFNVFVDTISPTITLNGESNLTIYNGTIYVDQNATASDASYGDIIITGVGTVDTQVLGTYTINYLAPEDYAGNIGSSVTRTVNVLSPIKIVHHPDVSYVTSSNINSSYAKAGDTLSIEFTTNNIITSGTASILGLNPTIIQNGHDFKASIIVPSTPMEGYAIFDVQVTDIFGTTLSITEDDLDFNVFVDTISPTITLNGESNLTIYNGTIYVDQNATASDASYGDIIITGVGTVDTQVLGTYTINYLAPEDYAGNIGSNVIRTVIVVDDPRTNSPASTCTYDLSFYNIIEGTNSADVLNGTWNHDLIYGLGGDDVINGLGGNDCIYGDGGHDVIYGNSGHDVIIGGNGHDTIHGGFGDDTIIGGFGLDILNGDGGHDIINGGGASDLINGNGGNDILDGGGANDTIIGGNGHDTIIGGNGHDIIHGGFGNDTIVGGFGLDILNGDGGHDIINGGGASDLINGNGGNDILDGGEGNDTIIGGNGHDIIHGGFGNDTIAGGSGLDTLNGNAGNDILNGGGANDTINGGDGDDIVDGGSHFDIINGDDGNDVCVTAIEDIVDCEIKS